MRYNRENDTIELDIDELCRAALAQGDLDSKGLSYHERASDRSKIYNKLHLNFGMRYYDHVEMSNTCKLEGIYFCVSGAADGILCLDEGYAVDEVVIAEKNKISDVNADNYHTARLNCLAYFLCSLKSSDTVVLRSVTYICEGGEISTSESRRSIDELRSFYKSLLSKILWRAHIIRERALERIPAAAQAIFPYKSLRDSQAEMIKESYRDMKHGSRLFCQAPTGIGKTVSTLYPALKCIGDGVADKVFYLTSKQSIRREALSAMKKMNEAGTALRTCVISAREGMCPNDGAKMGMGRLSSYCKGSLCPYAKDYYSKLSYALADIISSSDRYDSQTIRQYALKHRICPYEFSLDLSELCDVIVCDYNYVFSPLVYLKRYFDFREENSEKYIFLVDEAHNLPNRARDMFSARLSTSDVESLIAALEPDSSLIHSCFSLREAFKKVGQLCDDNIGFSGTSSNVGYSVTRTVPENFSDELLSFEKKCDSWLKKNTEHPARAVAEEVCYKLFEYRKISERYSKGYITFVTKENDEVSMLLYCLDPAEELSSALDRAQASVLFSATLTPTDYFADILGGGKKTVSVAFPAPFPKENLCVAVADGISTRYEDRERSYKKVSSCIAATLSAKPGNYMAFFPSYSYMEEVRKIFSEKYPKVDILTQSKNMTMSEKEEFLSRFKDDKKTRIAFCVLGGSFSEGIDLPGGRLIGAIVVGVGLPGLSDENNMIRDYYEEKCGMGYDYAYTYPGFNSVLQAVGRVIRTENDRGIAVLIDDRYSEPKYRALFPKEWKGAKFARNAQSLAEIARIFWKKGE